MSVETAFLGSGPLGRAMLRALCDAGTPPAIVVSQPPRRRRRRGRAEPTPVHAFAIEQALAVHLPENVNTADSLGVLRSAAAELFVVAEYGQILKQALLDIPPRGTINVHTSLLPRWRGATPIAAAILAGDSETGVTIQRTVRALDAGPVLHQVMTAIAPDETRTSLTRKLEKLGAQALGEVLARFAAGEDPPGTPQDDSLVVVCRRLKPADGRIDWSAPAAQIERQIRAYHPGPGAHTVLDRNPELPLDLRAARALPGEGEPGRVLATGRDHFDVGTGEGVLSVTRVLPASRKEMDARAFLNGVRLQSGERFR